MEIADLSWNKVISNRFNNAILPRSIRGIIVGKSGCFCLIFYLDRAGSMTITFAFSEKVFFNPNTEYLKEPSKKILRKRVF